MDIEEINLLKKFNPGDEYTERIKSAIEHLLAEREEDKKRIKELEEENRIFKDSNVLVNRYFKLKDNSIPVQKVKEILIEIQEEYNKLDKEIDKQIKVDLKASQEMLENLEYHRDVIFIS